MAFNRRSGSDEIRRGLFGRINTGFDYQRVNGLTSKPPITQNPTRQTGEPYIYVFSVREREVDQQKRSTPKEYYLYVEICARYNSYGGGQRQVNRMMDEVVRAIRNNGYPDLSSVGYSIYNLTIGEIEEFSFKERGANYYKARIPVLIRAEFVELPQDVNPVQALIYQFSGFAHTPTNNRIEEGDSGAITFNETYPSNNNGWDFTSVSYAVAPGAQGSLADRVYTIGSSDETLGVTGQLSYEFGTDTDVTTTINDTQSFSRIKSLRFGSSTAETFTVNDLQNLSSFNIQYGTDNPAGVDITITPNVNEYPYIIFDDQYSITEIKGTLGLNEISAFTRSDVGGYTIYRLTDAIPYAGITLTYTLE